MEHTTRYLGRGMERGWPRIQWSDQGMARLRRRRPKPPTPSWRCGMEPCRRRSSPGHGTATELLVMGVMEQELDPAGRDRFRCLATANDGAGRGTADRAGTANRADSHGLGGEIRSGRANHRRCRSGQATRDDACASSYRGSDSYHGQPRSWNYARSASHSRYASRACRTSYRVGTTAARLHVRSQNTDRKSFHSLWNSSFLRL